MRIGMAYHWYIELMASDNSLLLDLSMQQVSTQTNVNPSSPAALQHLVILLNPLFLEAILRSFISWKDTSSLPQQCESIAYGYGTSAANSFILNVFTSMSRILGDYLARDSFSFAHEFLNKGALILKLPRCTSCRDSCLPRQSKFSRTNRNLFHPKHKTQQGYISCHWNSSPFEDSLDEHLFSLWLPVSGVAYWNIEIKYDMAYCILPVPFNLASTIISQSALI